MNQSCRVCGEVAAGYHFGAFTCEGCKSFFGRTYNNRSSIGECKNGNQCIINKKNRTSCKSCRLKKCFSVGMSKSGSRYGRRSNWFKIHCLLQDQGLAMQQHQQQQQLEPNQPQRELHQQTEQNQQQQQHHEQNQHQPQQQQQQQQQLQQHQLQQLQQLQQHLQQQHQHQQQQQQQQHQPQQQPNQQQPQTQLPAGLDQHTNASLAANILSQHQGNQDSLALSCLLASQLAHNSPQNSTPTSTTTNSAASQLINENNLSQLINENNLSQHQSNQALLAFLFYLCYQNNHHLYHPHHC